MRQSCRIALTFSLNWPRLQPVSQKSTFVIPSMAGKAEWFPLPSCPRDSTAAYFILALGNHIWELPSDQGNWVGVGSLVTRSSQHVASLLGWNIIFSVSLFMSLSLSTIVLISFFYFMVRFDLKELQNQMGKPQVFWSTRASLSGAFSPGDLQQAQPDPPLICLTFSLFLLVLAMIIFNTFG